MKTKKILYVGIVIALFVSCSPSQPYSASREKGYAKKLCDSLFSLEISYKRSAGDYFGFSQMGYSQGFANISIFPNGKISVDYTHSEGSQLETGHLKENGSSSDGKYVFEFIKDDRLGGSYTVYLQEENFDDKNVVKTHLWLTGNSWQVTADKSRQQPKIKHTTEDKPEHETYFSFIERQLGQLKLRTKQIPAPVLQTYKQGLLNLLQRDDRFHGPNGLIDPSATIDDIIFFPYETGFINETIYDFGMGGSFMFQFFFIDKNMCSQITIQEDQAVLLTHNIDHLSWYTLAEAKDDALIISARGYLRNDANCCPFYDSVVLCYTMDSLKLVPHCFTYAEY